MLYYDKDPDRMMQEKKREILQEMEHEKIRILKELSGVDKYTLTRLREIIANFEEMAEGYADETAIQNAIIDAFVKSYPVSLGTTAFVSKIYSTSETPVDAVQDAIDGGIKTLIIDRAVTWDSPIYIPSNCTVLGMGGRVNFTGTGCFIARGSLGAEITIEGTDYGVGSRVITGDYEKLNNAYVGDNFFIKGTTNLLDRDAAGDYFLGEGTASDTTRKCYAGDFVRCVEKPFFGEFRIDTPLSLPYGGMKLWRVTPSENVRFINLDIVYDGELNRDGVIHFDTALNGQVSGCRIVIDDGGTAIGSVTAKNLLIEHNILSVFNLKPAQHYDDNIIRLKGTSNSAVRNNVISGGTQNIDITYAGEGIVSHDILIEGNYIDATYTGITTHPGTIDCLILDNHIYSAGDGIAVRGKRHTIGGNKIHYSGTASNDYGIGIVEGSGDFSTVEGNTIDGFPYALYLHETVDTETGRNCSFPARLNVTFKNNTVNKCPVFIGVRGDTANSGTVKLNLDAENNRIIDGDNVTLLSVPACGARRFSCVNIVGNSVSSVGTLQEFDVNTAVTFINYMRNRFQLSAINRGNIGTGGMTGLEHDNTVLGTPTVSGTPTLRALSGGIELPKIGVEGQRFLLSGTKYIYTNGNWQTE